MNKNESQSIKIVNGWLKRKILNYDLWNFEDIQSNYDLDIYCDICSKKIFGTKPTKDLAELVLYDSIKVGKIKEKPRK